MRALGSRLELPTGATMNVFRHGAARTQPVKCLLLHGNPGSLAHWQYVIPHLADAAEVAAIDLPGFGASPRPGTSSESVNLDRLAEHVLGAAQALGWTEPFHLVGYSHGGGVGQTLAARYPEKLASLVLVGTLGYPAQLSYRCLSTRWLGGALRWAGGFLPTRALRHTGVSMVDVTRGEPCEQLRRSAHQIRCPVLFLHGERDWLVPPRHGRAIHEVIVAAGGNSRFELLADTGHMLLRRRARELGEQIVRFITRSSS